MQNKNETPVIWWIRRDLRLMNNPALNAALSTGLPVLPVFILNDHLLATPETRRQRFLVSGLHRLSEGIREKGGGLVVRRGDPVVELYQLVKETGAIRIFTEEDYSPYSRKRDRDVSRELPLQSVTGLTVHHPSAIQKDDGTPYTIFTPFNRKWKSLPEFHPADMQIGQFAAVSWTVRSDLLPQEHPVEGFPAGEKEAGIRLRTFLEKKLGQYETTRNRMDLDGTSSLSPYLRFGMLSPSYLVAQIRELVHVNPENSGPKTWLNELIWREFYQAILFYFPQVKVGPFNPKYSHVEWRHAPEDLHTWKQGMTGYPVVDAAMRQLISTGWMHNRARMITASFFTKDLLIDWREGERWFMEQLVDGDIASNNGGWQWSAGTGTDATPYYRIFNPVLQGKKFDPLGDYVRQWVPELRDVPVDWIHEPWLLPGSVQTRLGIKIGETYPLPMVDHRMARERALAAYKAAAGAS